MNVMTWAACSLAFFGFSQVGKFTVPFHKQFYQAYHLCLGDITGDNQDNLQMLPVKTEQLKTEFFCKEVTGYN